MRCYICDKLLTDAEIQYIPHTKSFDCCSVCLEVAMDAAYSDGYVKSEASEVAPEDQQLLFEFGDGSVELLLDDGPNGLHLGFHKLVDHSDD